MLISSYCIFSRRSRLQDQLISQCASSSWPRSAGSGGHAAIRRGPRGRDQLALVAMLPSVVVLVAAISWLWWPCCRPSRSSWPRSAGSGGHAAVRRGPRGRDGLAHVAKLSHHDYTICHSFSLAGPHDDAVVFR